MIVSLFSKLKIISLAVVGIGSLGYVASAPMLLGGGSEIVKPPKEWKQPEDFKKYCFGNILSYSATNKGELIVCQDKSRGIKDPPILFYLWWKEDSSFTRVSEIKGVSPASQEISFEFNKEGGVANYSERKLKVVNGQNLNGLTNKPLESTCKIEYESKNQTYWLSCSNSSYKVVIDQQRLTF